MPNNTSKKKNQKKEKYYYKNIKLPGHLVDRIKDLIDEYPRLFGYRNPSEFVIEVTRIRLEKFENDLSNLKNFRNQN